MERPWSGLLTKLGLAALACNSALAIYSSWGDAGSVAFVLATDAALLLFFFCLREIERAAAGREGAANMGGQYSALANMGLAVLNCNMALDACDVDAAPGSPALAFVFYAALVILIADFVLAFARGHGTERGHAD
ncbi:unnamed protein product [Urochloa humidicola]